MRSIKYLLFLLLFSPTSFFAADKPAWTIDYKKLNIPQHPKPVRIGKEVPLNPGYKVQFSPDNNVLISFWEHRPQTELVTKDSPEKSGTIFVVLLLSRESGELIRRIEWPVTGEWRSGPQMSHGSRIYPLPSGGYVGIINRHLQVFDSSFKVIHNRALEVNEYVGYDLITPLYGQYFVLRFSGYREWRTTEIINSETFEIVERLNVKNSIIDVWGNRLLGFYTDTDIKKNGYEEKKIGVDLKWNDLGLTQGGYSEAKYIYNGTIIVTDVARQSPGRKGFWFTIEEGKKSDPVFKDRLIFKPSWNTPIIANRVGKESALREALDLDTPLWIEAYNINTREIVLATKKYTNMVGHAISPDGNSIAVMTTKKIELYNVNPQYEIYGLGEVWTGQNHVDKGLCP